MSRHDDASGTVVFIARHLKDILGRNDDLPQRTQAELRLLLDAIGELHPFTSASLVG